MKNPATNFHHRHLLLLFLLLIAAGKFRFQIFADASQRKIHIPDELDDVVDSEEDDDWREWGKTKKQPESDPQGAPVFGFVKLRPGTPRIPEMVSEIAMKWSKVARAGATEARFNAVDASTLMFTMPKGRDVLELKEFLLNQPEAYEIKIGDRLYRRPGDPTFDEVFRKMKDGDKSHHEL